MIFKVLDNGWAKNLLKPSKDGDVGYNVLAHKLRIVGKIHDSKNKLHDEVVLYKTGDGFHLQYSVGPYLQESEITEERFATYLSGIKWDSVQFVEYDTGLITEPYAFSEQIQPVGLGENGIVTCQLSSTDFYASLLPRSSNSNFDLILANSVGVSDPNYRGTLRFRYAYRFQPQDLRVITSVGFNYLIVGVINYDKIYKLSDPNGIGQLIFHDILHPAIQIVPQLSETSRGGGGFGSTNKK